VTVSGDLFAVGNENDRTHFAIAGHRPEGHNLRQHLKAGADPDIFVVVRHWQAFEVYTVAMVDQGIGDKEFFIQKDAEFAGVLLP
jgi:hypothetical protein